MTCSTGLTGCCYTTLLVLAQKADDASGQCWPSRRTIAFMANQSERTTTWAIDELEKAGWIEVARNGAPRRCNRYSINLEKLRAESVRPSQKAVSTPVENPVEKLLISCGQDVEKPVETGFDGANSCTQSFREYEVKSKEQVENRDYGRGPCVFPALPPSPPPTGTDVLGVLNQLNRTIAKDPRARGAPLAGLRPLLA